MVNERGCHVNNIWLFKSTNDPEVHRKKGKRMLKQKGYKFDDNNTLKRHANMITYFNEIFMCL